jgi:class 3 adenylate cyclase/tetratricopeptide (TPR) repeat protein
MLLLSISKLSGVRILPVEQPISAGRDSRRGRHAFVDRVSELAELKGAIDEAVAGRGHLFTLSGEPGVGKSRISQEATAYAEARGARALWGRCWDHGGAPPYWAWMQVMRGLTDGVESAALAGWLGAGAAEIAQIVPELRQKVGGLPELPSAELAQPEMARFRLFDSVVSFLRKAAETQPLLIVLDDLHAADPTSLTLMVALARQIRTMRAVVIATYREVEVKHQPELASIISDAERDGTVFALRGLEAPDIHEFLERVQGVSASDPLVEQLREITEGNLFFLHEVVRQMTSQGRIDGDHAIDARRLGVTRGVSDLIKKLARPLSKDARSALDIAAVIGREFSVEALEAASGKRRDDLVAFLDEAVSLELIDEAPGARGRYSFRHALIREALYDALPASTRRRLHRDIAEAVRAMASSVEPAAEIAYHFCRAGSTEAAELAIEYSRQASRMAGRQLAYEEAANHLRNAIEALQLKRSGGERLHAELLCELGEAQVKSGDLREGRKTCLIAADLARQADLPDLLARAIVTAGRGVSNSGQTDDGLVRLLNEALERLGDADSPLRAQALARVGVELYWSDQKQSVILCEQAAEMARRLNDPHTTIIALWGRHLSRRDPDGLEQRLADGRDAIEIAERENERDFALEARYYRSADLIEAGDIDAFERGVRQYLTAEAQLRDRFKRGLILQAMQALIGGRLPEAGALAQQAFVAGQQSGRPLALNSFLVQHGHAMWELGRLGELEAPLKAFVAQNPLIVFGRIGLQMSLLQLGRVEEARAAFESLAREEFRAVPRDWNWIPSMFMLAEHCAELGSARHAEPLYRLLSPYAARNAVLGYAHTYGSVAYALGRLTNLLGRETDAEAHFEAALAANQRNRNVVWTAHAQFELGRLLVRREGEARERGKRLLEAVRREADASDFVRLKRKLERYWKGEEVGEAAPPSASVEVTQLEGPPSRDAVRPGGGDPLETLAASVASRVRNLGVLASIDGAMAILFSDVEDSTSLYDRLGDQRAVDLIRMHNDIFRREVAAHRGHEVKSLGDGFMIAFSSAQRAALCAMAVQRAFRAYSESHADAPMRVRIGLHVGPAIDGSSDLFGRSVVVASRIAGTARGGQIVASSALRDLLAEAGDVRFAPLGERQLKGFSAPYALFEVAW